MQKRNILNSPRLLGLKRRKRRFFLFKIFLFVFAVSAICYGLVYVSRTSIFNISGIEITGNKVVDAEIVKASVEKEITGNYLWFFPKTNILFYPKNSIKDKLYDEFKGLKDIKFSIKNKKVLEVSLSERVGLYTWCGNVLPDVLDNNQKCYFMDEEGFIFDKAPYFSGEVYFRFYGEISVNNGDPSGSYFLREDLEKLVLFKNTLEDMGLKPTALYKEKNENIKLLLSKRNSSSTRPEILFKINSDFKSIAENLETALSTEPLLSDFKNKYSSLLYIDLRFGNKVYYKFTK